MAAGLPPAQYVGAEHVMADFGHGRLHRLDPWRALGNMAGAALLVAAPFWYAFRPTVSEQAGPHAPDVATAE